jgi:hypothetical protein
MRRVPLWTPVVAVAVLWLGGLVVYLAMQVTPVGGLRGIVLAEETGNPLPGARVQLTGAASWSAPPPSMLHGFTLPQLRRQPWRAPAPTFEFRTHGDGRFIARRIPAGLYELRVTTRAHSLRPVTVRVTEGETSNLTLELSPGSPFLEVQTPWHTVTLEETPQVIVNGFITNQVVNFRFYRVDPETLFVKAQGSLQWLLQSHEPPRHQVIAGNPALTPAGQYSAEITRHDAEGVFRQRIDLPSLRGKPGIYLVAAQADSIEQITWVTVTKLGMIVKRWGTDVLSYVVDIKTGEPVPGAAVELSLSSGAGSTSRPVQGQTDGEGLFQSRVAPKPGGEQRLFARAEKDGSQAFTRVWMDSGEGAEQMRVYAYTDRPVYRPGHVVNFKGIARSFVNDSYLVPAAKPVEVQVWDPRETLVYKGDLTTDQYGGFDGQLRLNDEAATGLYRLVSTIDDRPHESYFKVAEYKKPEYSVEVKPGRERYIRGETIEAEVTAEYYFGAPVAGAEVKYSVFRSPYYLSPGWSDEEDVGDEYGDEGDGEYGGYGGEMILEGTAKTDERGLVRLTIPTTSATQRRLEEFGRAEGPGDSEYRIEATVTDPSRRPVTETGSAIVTQGEFFMSAQPLKFISSPGEETPVEITAEDYDGKPVRGVRAAVTAGEEIWSRGQSRLETELRTTVTTDDKGKAVVRFTPAHDGFYRMEVTATDRRGNRIRTTGYLWVTGGAYADLSVPYPEIEVIADKKQYRAGDTATFLINSKYKGATALVSVEGPRLYEKRLVPLKGTSTRVSVPIRQEYGPNFFFAVALIQNKHFANQQKRVKVSVEERQLQVTVKANKDRYAPGERATYEITTADWKGRPTAAEVSLGVVDESIYAIQSEMAEPILRFFYPPRENSVETTYSFWQIYLDADKEAVSIEVRKRFPDTAYWNPRLVTGADGRGRVSFAMPDSLTTWRATARAITMDTAVGQVTEKVKCSKDLLVRLETPRFMTQKDRMTFSAIAHNYTRGEQALAMWLTAPGLKFVGRGGDEKRMFSLGADGIKREDWQVSAPTPGTVDVTAYLKAGSGLSDGMQLPLPVLPHGRERMEWRSGAASGTISESLSVRRDAVPGASDLRVRLSPSLASAILGALDYLAQYPYGCTEQTMSAFLPDVIVARTLRELHLPNAKIERELPDMVQAGLSRLYGFQHSDGGWGWWRYDQSDPWMTAYVVFGLLTAKRSGFSVNDSFITGGVNWLARAAKQDVPQREPAWHGARQRIYPLYVLALTEKGEAADVPLSRMYQNMGALDPYALSFLTAALLARGREAEARVCANRLWQKATGTQATLYWRGAADEGKGGGTETTAVAFRALYSLYPGDPRLLRIIRWLMLNREGNHWVSTRDTAFVLYAITEFVKQSQELTPDYQATVALNGKVIASRRVTQADLFAPEMEIRAPAGSLPSGTNVLTITKEGRGSLYYTLILRQFVGQEDMTELVTGSGISVNRQYYRMQTSRNPRTGEITIAPAPRPATSFSPGEAVLVRLTVRAPQEYEFVIVEDPIPAGCEVAEQGGYMPYEWDRWWSDMDIRDEKVAVFARTLPRGSSTIEYHLRPQIPGDYHVMPTQVYSMYNPELRGSGAEARVTLR